MYTTHLRKVGGSVMMALPPAILEMLGLGPGSAVGVAVDDGRLVLEPRTRPSYTLDELLAQCDPNAPMEPEDREWLEAEPVGKEII